MVHILYDFFQIEIVIEIEMHQNQRARGFLRARQEPGAYGGRLWRSAAVRCRAGGTAMSAVV